MTLTNIKPTNEPVLTYAPGSDERSRLKAMIDKLRSTEKEVPMYINNQAVITNDKRKISPPHDLKHTLGHYHYGDASHVKMAINAAIEAKAGWSAMPWKERAEIFLRAADLASGPWREKLNAATMLCQSKNAYQAEIDSACELIDFWRFNIYFAEQLFQQQPISPEGIKNSSEYRPLEGFVVAITPFNFTAISGNLPTAAALMGNTVIWKPANSQVYSAMVVMELLIEAGLPPGVINLVHADGPELGNEVFNHPDFGGLHFTGSTKVFQHLWRTISNNLENYKSYPRIVGETGGKDFIIAHHSAKVQELVTAMVRGAFEFQGQKCSAASRVYIPDNLWPEVKDKLQSTLKELKMGPPEDFSNFINAVIDKAAFDKIAGFIDHGKSDPELELIAGGNYDDSKGYFIEPTVFLSKTPKSKLMVEEIFGPVLTIYVYPENEYEQTLKLVNETSPYGLTGAVFAEDKKAVALARCELYHAAGNFYINDKPTGAVVGQQPFGGARGSGTNDKAGSLLNLIRWVSPLTVKENLNPPGDYRYPFMGE